MKFKKNERFYDQDEINDQKQYESNPLAQLIKQEQLDLIRILAFRSKDSECKYFSYLLKHYVHGLTLREIAKEENTYTENVRSRMEQALRYLKREVLRYNMKIDTPE